MDLPPELEDDEEELGPFGAGLPDGEESDDENEIEEGIGQAAAMQAAAAALAAEAQGMPAPLANPEKDSSWKEAMDELGKDKYRFSMQDSPTFSGHRSLQEIGHPICVQDLGLQTVDHLQPMRHFLDINLDVELLGFNGQEFDREDEEQRLG